MCKTKKPKTALQRQIKSRRLFKKKFGLQKWVAENRLTQITASNNRAEWTDKDDRFVVLDLPVIKKAVLLGRTKSAVEHRIKLLNSK
jgi:hypothetical protein